MPKSRTELPFTASQLREALASALPVQAFLLFGVVASSVADSIKSGEDSGESTFHILIPDDGIVASFYNDPKALWN